VTIIDPCHPLYNRTFPLLLITNHHGLEPCCQVQIAPGGERMIPVRQTSLSSSAPVAFSSPFDLSSLHNLIETFASILAQVEMERSDETRGTTPTNNGRDNFTTSMGDTGSHSTTDGPANRGQSLPTDYRDPGTGGQR
jgi:hypothetical protein